jgi:threonine/homoserine/homoserine lactone efflux protein
MSINMGRQIGFKRAFPVILGMISGFTSIMFLTAMFNIYLGRVMPFVRGYIGAIGALYILWLAAKMFMPRKGGSSAIPGESRPFLTGVMLQFINPKVFFYGLTIMGGFILPYYDSPPATLLFSAGLGLINLTSLSCWACFGAIFQRCFKAHEKALNVIMAALLVYCAYSVSGLGK